MLKRPALYALLPVSALAAALLFYFSYHNVSFRFYAVLIAATAVTCLAVFLFSRIKIRAVKYILPLLLLVCAGVVFIYALTGAQDLGRLGFLLFGCWLEVPGALGLLEAAVIDVFSERLKKKQL